MFSESPGGSLPGFLIFAAIENQKVSIKPKPESKWRDLGSLAAPPPALLKRLREDTDKQDRKELRDAAAKVVITADPSTRNTLSFQLNVSHKAARKGPFCRVTCSGCHGQWDVETAPELCRANWIPPGAEYVPGWIAVSDEYEVNNAWLVPASAGFENYKLYWSELQSKAEELRPGRQ